MTVHRIIRRKMFQKLHNSSVVPYKSCIAPYCTSTTIHTPQKNFIYVPRRVEIREKWCKAAGIHKEIQINAYMCEDHFCLSEDLENYLEWQMMGGNKELKAGVIPRFFSHKTSEVETLKRISSFSEIERSSLLEYNRYNHEERSYDENKSVEVTQQSFSLRTNHYSVDSRDSQSRSCQRSIGTQVQIKYKSIGINCVPQKIPGFLVDAITSVTSPIASNNSSATKEKSGSERVSDKSSGQNTLETVNSSLFDGTVNSNNSNYVSSAADYSEDIQELLTKVFESTTKIFIEDNPLLFLGIPKESMYVINEIINSSGQSRRNVYLTLKKIRQNTPNAILRYEFGLSESQISRIFHSTIRVIVQYLKQLIVWPSPQDIILNLPMAFRLRYSSVQSIIDCFEISIEQLSNPVHQALTWSEYKKSNTAKYLLSITPDGLINFVSPGYGGRTSDVEIVQKSGYLQLLPAGASVLADRGFKNVETTLQMKKCKLLRPPSVSSDARSTESEVKLTKQVASVRIHVERVIRRLREFKMLQPHSTVDHNLLEVLDDVVIVAAALVNLQSRIINTFD